MKICVYGAASKEIRKEYVDETYKLGVEIAKRKHELVFGGGSTGVMGATSRGVLDNKGKVIGIAPEWMEEFEGICRDCDKFIYTSTMDERKNLFLKYSDAFIIGPGGVGTLDEFFEIVTLKKLKVHDKPIILFNINHFYDSLIEMIDFMVKEKVIPKETRSLVKICKSVKETLDYIENNIQKE